MMDTHKCIAIGNNPLGQFDFFYEIAIAREGYKKTIAEDKI
jgi:hypothetical protein